jgi:uncharacterized protein YciI
MPQILICRDKPGALATRKATREAHLSYVEETGLVRFAGPMKDEDGNPCGSVIVLGVDDRDAAQTWAENDPYAKAGLFESVEIRGFDVVVGG